MKSKNKTLYLTQFSILLAIEAVFCFTPLGSIPMGVIVATLMAIPVIITAVLLGPKAGTLMGAFSGVFSLIVWTFTPPNPAVAFVFSPFYASGEFTGNIGSLVICIVPRVLVGTVPGIVYKALSKGKRMKDVFALSISAVLGSLVNTVGVLGGIWLFFGAQYSSALGGSLLAIIGFIILTNGIPEAVVNAVVVPAVCKPVKAVLKKSYG